MSDKLESITFFDRNLYIYIYIYFFIFNHYYSFKS